MKQKGINLLFFCVLIILTGVGCKDSKEGNEGGEYDPSKPIVFNDFNPKEGSVRTKLFIEGENFGNDISKIKVSIGDLNAAVIGSTGNQIYCMVPPLAYGEIVNVTIVDDAGNPIAEHKFETPFSYVAKQTVGTLTGKIDPATNTTSIIDGAFSEAEFISPYWLGFDNSEQGGGKHLYVTEQDRALRLIDIEEKTVSTVVTNGLAGLRKLQTTTMDVTGDTIFFVDDNGQNNKTRAVLSYSIRKESFRRVYPYIFDRTGYSCAQHPDGSIFYNTYWNAEVMKVRGQYNETTEQWESKAMFNVVANVSGHTYITMHPSGLYAYITGANYTSVYKARYNAETKELEAPVIFVGSLKSSGYVDAPGGTARFSGSIRQGVFAKNHQYVEEGREDVYDFYLCDAGNNVIRKITPDGQVTTFAGNGSYTAGDNRNDTSGYIDGDLRLEARFKNPCGIAYDDKNEVFYVADFGNKRIRYIGLE